MTDTDRSNAGQTAMQPCTHDGIAAQETWRDCTAAHGGRLRLVLLAPDPQSAAPLLEQPHASPIPCPCAPTRRCATYGKPAANPPTRTRRRTPSCKALRRPTWCWPLMAAMSCTWRRLTMPGSWTATGRRCSFPRNTSRWAGSASLDANPARIARVTTRNRYRQPSAGNDHSVIPWSIASGYSDYSRGSRTDGAWPTQARF